MNALSFSLTRREPTRIRSAGFTLIEVIVTLTIFIILTASVFSIMTAVFQSSNVLKDNQNRRDEVSALRAYLKNDFEGLSTRDHFISYRRGDGEGLRVTGILIVTDASAMVIDATRQANGLYLLRLGRPMPDADPPTLSTFAQQVDKNESALQWTPLVRDVRKITWQFQSSPPEWLDDWNSDMTRPSLVECGIQLAGDDKPTAMDFSIPHLTSSPSQQEVASHAP